MSTAATEKIPDLFSPPEEWKDAKASAPRPSPVEFPDGVAIFAEVGEKRFKLDMYPVFVSPGKRKRVANGSQAYALVCEIAGTVGFGAKIVIVTWPPKHREDASNTKIALISSGYTDVEIQNRNTRPPELESP